MAITTSGPGSRLVVVAPDWDGFDFKVSWVALQDQTPEVAEDFARRLLAAARQAKASNRKAGRRPAGTGGYMDPANPTGYYSR